LSAFGTLIGWGDQVPQSRVRVTADTPEDARTSIKFGCEGKKSGFASPAHFLQGNPKSAPCAR